MTRRHASLVALPLTLALACTDGGGGDDEIGNETETTATSSDSSGSESSESNGESASTDADTSTTDTSTSDADTGTTDTGTSDTSTTDTGTSDTGTTDTSTTDTGTETGMVEPSDIEVVITADNAYGFGYGSIDLIDNYYGGIENTTAGQIFNCGEGPELYMIPADVAESATHLYIVAWADSSVTQGVLGRFRRLGGFGGFGEAVLTGDPGWEVCATGIDYQPGSGGPPLMQVNQLIGSCNADALNPATTSVGWVDEVGTQFGAVAVGEDNTTPYNGGPQAGNEFPLTCQMDMPPETHWMWFNWDPQNVIWPQTSPFLWPGGNGNPDHQFLIFRLAAELIPEPQ
ncbi:hypothetical protein ACNOYE_04335 [Nannocystaceae bacterium ST9]